MPTWINLEEASQYDLSDNGLVRRTSNLKILCPRLRKFKEPRYELYCGDRRIAFKVETLMDKYFPGHGLIFDEAWADEALMQNDSACFTWDHDPFDPCTAEGKRCDIDIIDPNLGF